MDGIVKYYELAVLLSIKRFLLVVAKKGERSDRQDRENVSIFNHYYLNANCNNNNNNNKLLLLLLTTTTTTSVFFA